MSPSISTSNSRLLKYIKLPVASIKVYKLFSHKPFVDDYTHDIY